MFNSSNIVYVVLNPNPKWSRKTFSYASTLNPVHIVISNYHILTPKDSDFGGNRASDKRRNRLRRRPVVAFSEIVIRTN